MGKRLYVGNLPYDTDDSRLTEAFTQDGRKVDRVHIVTDRETGRPRGFAFVEMATDEDAKAAIEAMDGFELGGRRLRVSEAEERRPAAGPRPERRPSTSPDSQRVPFTGRGDPPSRRKKEGGKEAERQRGGSKRRREEQDEWESGKRGGHHGWDDDEEW